MVVLYSDLSGARCAPSSEEASAEAAGESYRRRGRLCSSGKVKTLVLL